MKNVLVIGFLFLSLVGVSQRIVDKSVGDFNEVKVYDLIEVNLIKSDENKVLVKGDNVDDIQIINKNGVLKIKMELDKKFHGENTFVEVYFKNIDLIDGNEGARITVNETLSQEKIELKTQEGAKIKVGLDVHHLVVRCVTGGIVEASGKTINQEVVLNTGGVFEGKPLRSEKASIKITAAGEAEMYVSEAVDINIKAGGDVYVYGNPRSVNKNTFAGGRVKVMD
ncbi:head GIN domain-containing protein [Arenibacter sp. M-2]|uniref:head GIN domain-containing protein n=1 Tax=unclassified Arenibacter TaxID=2615047 RepID=UPI000D765B2B|nr:MULTISPECIES: head GIN domain-containing protein [unclassified Arenibacter]MDL5513166.1 head GIN domain-containing protein [Arenibacter sp. M-2]PXX28972.1 putative autotransporter adhesin-like protein [Arenibacter sp. ARW7G5Y1]|tara:strand:- start:7734 stop:8408 length:675 start_codon:yes stop_codon:yes gene_type:complete